MMALQTRKASTAGPYIIIAHIVGFRAIDAYRNLRSSSDELTAQGCPDATFPHAQIDQARAFWKRDKFRSSSSDNGNPAVVAYAVRDGKLYRRKVKEQDHVHWNYHAVEALLWSTLQRFPQGVADADLHLVYGDTAGSVSTGVPLFAFSSPRTRVSSNQKRHQDAGRVIGFPNPYFLCELQDMLHKGNDTRPRRIPWKDKTSKAFWRGSLTTHLDVVNVDQLKDQPRIHLGDTANKHPQYLDVAFTEVDDGIVPAGLRPTMQSIFRSFKESEAVDFWTTLPRFKYVLNVDGVSAAWRGLSAMASGSVMLLEDASEGEFFVDDLVPGKDFIPLKKDMSDLVSQVAHLQQNDDMAAHVAEQASNFVSQKLSYAATECYVLESLRFMSEFPKQPVDQLNDYLPVEDKYDLGSACQSPRD